MSNELSTEEKLTELFKDAVNDPNPSPQQQAAMGKIVKLILSAPLVALAACGGGEDNKMTAQEVACYEQELAALASGDDRKHGNPVISNRGASVGGTVDQCAIDEKKKGMPFINNVN